MSPIEKKPSAPDLEFALDDAIDAPTGKYAPPDVLNPVPRAPTSDRATLPAPVAPPTAPVPAKGSPKRKDSPSSRAAAPPYQRKSRTGAHPHEKRTTAPAPALPRTRVPSHPAMDVFDRVLMGDDDDLEFGRGFTAGSRPPVAHEPIAPRPPRMPELGPSSHAALDLEVIPKAPLSAPPSATAHQRKATTPARRAVRPPDDDLAWEPAGRGVPPPLPPSPDLTLPLALDARPGDAHALAERASRAPAPLSTDPRREMMERFALGDFSGALVVAEGLHVHGRRDADVDRVIEECRARLSQMYIGRLGDLRRVPVMAVPRTELKWLSLDHRAGFVLSLVDGASNLEEILDVAGMPALEVLRTLFDLVNQKVIELRVVSARR